MPPPKSKSTVIETTYENPNTGQRWKEIRVVEVPDDRIDFVRRRELAAFYGGEPDKSLVLRKNSQDDGREDEEEEDEYYSTRQIMRNPRYGSQTGLEKSRTTEDFSRRSRRQDERYLGSGGGDGRGIQRARSERRSRYGDDYQSQGQNGYGGQSQYRNQGRSQVQSQRGNQNQNPNQNQTRNANGNASQAAKDCVDEGPLTCNQQQELQGGFMDRHFDTGWDGVLSAAAGGIIGAMGARRFFMPLGKTEEENQLHSKKNRAKTIAGAVVGAVAVNAGEKAFKNYTEEHAERGENIATAMEFCGEGIDNLL